MFYLAIDENMGIQRIQVKNTSSVLIYDKIDITIV